MTKPNLALGCHSESGGEFDVDESLRRAGSIIFVAGAPVKLPIGANCLRPNVGWLVQCAYWARLGRMQYPPTSTLHALGAGLSKIKIYKILRGVGELPSLASFKLL